MQHQAAPKAPEDVSQLRALAESMDCFTEEQHLLMTGYSPETAKTKRKRGEGPPYIRLGKHYFYPRQAYREYMASRLRERPARQAVREAL